MPQREGQALRVAWAAIVQLKTVQAAEEAHRIVEEGLQWLATCPHGCGLHVVRNGLARGPQRYNCRDCGQTFNALTGRPLAGLRYRERWLGQTQLLIDGPSITKASQHLAVARSTVFRWRHRFLALPHHVKARRHRRGRRNPQVLQGPTQAAVRAGP